MPAAQYSDAVNGSEPGDGFEDNDDVSKVSPAASPCPALPRRAARARLWAGCCPHSPPLPAFAHRQIFFDYLARAYQLFLAGEDDTSALEEQAG